jgi:hypothetical protein
LGETWVANINAKGLGGDLIKGYAEVHPTRIRIRVAKRSGALVERWVKPEHLVPEGWPPHLPFIEEIGEDD